MRRPRSSRTIRVAALLATFIAATASTHAQTPAVLADGGMPVTGAPNASGQPTAAAAARQEPQEVEATRRAADRLRKRAEQLQALLKGKLEPAVSTTELLRFDLSGEDADDLGAVGGVLLSAIEEADSPRLRRARLSAAASEAADAAAADDPLTAARGEMQAALLSYLRLPDVRRTRLIAAHRQARENYLQLLSERDALSDVRKRLTARFKNAEAYLAGTLDPAVKPDGLFVLELSPSLPAGTTLPTATRRGAKVPAWQSELQDGNSDLREQIHELRDGLDKVSSRYAALTPGARKELETARKQKVLDAQDRQKMAQSEKRRATDMAEDATRARTQAEREQASAQAEREAALRAAEEARTEAQRMLAAEKARVLGRKAALSEIRGRIASASAELTSRYDGALGLVRKTRELRDRSVLDPNKVHDADLLYGDLRRALNDYHDQFSEALGWLLQPESRLPDALEPSDQEFLAEMDEPALNRMWGELRDLRSRVEAEEEQLGRDRAAKLRDAVVLLNDARLSLLKETSAALRAQASSFGPEGVTQAVSETRQMLLMTRYHLISLPNVIVQLRQRASGATLMILFSVVQVLLLIVAYRVYRKRAEPTLTRMYRDTLANASGESVSRLFARLLWYLRRLYEPLGAWAFAAAIFSFVRGIDLLPEIDFLWIVMQWFLVGWTAVLAVDAFAERQNKLMRQRSEDPKLRIRSLRLLAFFLLGTGMLLSLTERSVGEGTIFAWTRFIAWLGPLPVLAILAHWWEPQMKATMDARDKLPGILQWARRRMDGMIGVVGEVLAAAYLLGEGIARWAVRWLSDFELMQKLTAYLFRKKVQERSQNGEPASVAPPPQYDSFVPGGNVGEVLLPDMHDKALAKVLGAAKVRGTVSLVVGDRGMGKSCLLTRIDSDVAGKTLRLTCPTSLEALRSDLAVAASVDDDDDASLAAGLREAGYQLLLIDDVQRLVRPEVFGLHAFDGLLELLRGLRGVVATVMSCATPGYVLLSRGRGALGADCVTMLEPLTRRQITALVKSRCDVASIKPNYDELVVPRAFDIESTTNEDPVETGYFRLLWDYSGGNPAVALLYFQKSLFRDSRGRLVVRVFDEPDRVALDALPRNMPFVFRTLMQLSEGDITTVARCLNLSENETRDVIEMGVRRGYLEHVGDAVRVALPWLREIKVLLRRQHLLS